MESEKRRAKLAESRARRRRELAERARELGERIDAGALDGRITGPLYGVNLAPPPAPTIVICSADGGEAARLCHTEDGRLDVQYPPDASITDAARRFLDAIAELAELQGYRVVRRET